MAYIAFLVILLVIFSVIGIIAYMLVMGGTPQPRLGSGTHKQVGNSERPAFLDKMHGDQPEPVKVEKIKKSKKSKRSTDMFINDNDDFEI